LISEPNFKLAKSEVVPLTYELAEKYAAMTASPTERELHAARVKHLTEKVAAGNAVTFHWASALLDGHEVRVNGQHSSAALKEMNGSFPPGLMVHREVYEVSDVEGLALLFRQFDDRKSSRSPADVAGAYQCLYEPLRDVPRGTAKLGMEAIVWLNRHIVGLPVPTGDDIYTKFADPLYHNALRWLGEVITMKTPEMARIQVIAAMFATFETNEPEARDFWASVARGGVEFEENAPATVLDAWLKDQKDPRNLRPAKPAELYQGCVYAWKAFRDDQPLKAIKSDIKKGILEVAR
jgi:hypothetical protein